MKRFLFLIMEWLIILSTTLFSLYMYAHIVEKVFVIDLPSVGAITVTNAPLVNAQLGQLPEPANSDEKYGFYGRPLTVRFPRLGESLNLQEAQKDDDGWLVSDGSASYFVYSQSKIGRIGNFTIFAPDSSSLLSVLDQVVEGDRLIVETEKWVYSFRISRKMALLDGQKYLPAGQATTLTLVRPLEKGVTVVAEAQFVSVQEKESQR